jgi:hypothetical protein
MRPDWKSSIRLRVWGVRALAISLHYAYEQGDARDRSMPGDVRSRVAASCFANVNFLLARLQVMARIAPGFIQAQGP